MSSSHVVRDHLAFVFHLLEPLPCIAGICVVTTIPLNCYCVDAMAASASGIVCLLLASHWQRDTPHLQTILLNISRITKLLGSHAALFSLRKEPDALFSTVLCVKVSICQTSKRRRVRLNTSAKLRVKCVDL